MKFKTGTTYTETLSYCVSPIPNAVVDEIFRNGSNSIALIYAWLHHNFSNLKYDKKKSCDPYLLTDGKRRYQVRTVGTNCNANPSKHIGYDRSYNAIDHAEALRQIDYLILIDTKDMPTVTLAAINSKYFFDADGTPMPATSTETARAMISNPKLFED